MATVRPDSCRIHVVCCSVSVRKVAHSGVTVFDHNVEMPSCSNLPRVYGHGIELVVLSNIEDHAVLSCMPLL